MKIPPNSFESVWYYFVPVARYRLEAWWQQGDNPVLLDTGTGPAEMEYGDIFPRVATSGSFEVPEDVDLGPATVTFKLNVNVDYYCRDILENSHTWSVEQVYEFQVASNRPGGNSAGTSAPTVGGTNYPLPTADSSATTQNTAPAFTPPPAVLPSTGAPLVLVLAGGTFLVTTGLASMAGTRKRRAN